MGPGWVFFGDRAELGLFFFLTPKFWGHIAKGPKISGKDFFYNYLFFFPFRRQDDLVAQARVDEVLHWHHLNTRLACVRFFQVHYHIFRPEKKYIILDFLKKFLHPSPKTGQVDDAYDDGKTRQGEECEKVRKETSHLVFP